MKMFIFFGILYLALTLFNWHIVDANLPIVGVLCHLLTTTSCGPTTSVNRTML
jgi:hypothetical protein